MKKLISVRVSPILLTALAAGSCQPHKHSEADSAPISKIYAAYRPLEQIYLGEPQHLIEAKFPQLRPVEDASGPFCILDLPAAAACNGATVAYLYFDEKGLLHELNVNATLGARPYGLNSTCVKQTLKFFSRTANSRFEQFGLDSTDTFSHFSYQLSAANRLSKD